MPGKVKNSSKQQTMIRSVIFGVSTAVIICVLGLGLVSLMVYSGKIKETNYGFITAIIVFLAVFVGGVVSAKLRKGGVAVIGGITAVSFAMILFITNVLFFDAVFSGIWLNALMVILGWITASLAGARKKSKR